jgi:hypothetical protein
VGIPTAGPATCYSGEKCAGTVLSTGYPYRTDSRLISPTLWIPNKENIYLSFQHWYIYENGDYAIVQISVYDEINGWSSWIDLTNQIFGTSGVWNKFPNIALGPYKGQKVRIGFLHYTENDGGNSFGWYIDHIRIDGFPVFCDCDLDQKGSCNILDYQIFIQDWGRDDCGTPPGTGNLPNDCECDLDKSGACNILDYQRFIQDWGRKDCEICP